MKKEGRLGKGIASIFAENYIEEAVQSSMLNGSLKIWTAKQFRSQTHG